MKLFLALILSPLISFCSEPQWVTLYKTGEQNKVVETGNVYLYRGSVANPSLPSHEVCNKAILQVNSEIKDSLAISYKIPKVPLLTYFDEKKKECFVTIQVKKSDINFTRANSELLKKVEQFEKKAEVIEFIEESGQEAEDGKLLYLLETQVREGSHVSRVGRILGNSFDFALVKSYEQCYNKYTEAYGVDLGKYIACFSHYKVSQAFYTGYVEK